MHYTTDPPPATEQELVRRAHGRTANRSRRLAAARLSVLQQAHQHLVMAQIRGRWNSRELRELIEQHIVVSPNLAIDVTTASAVVYQRGCRRDLVGDVPEEQRTAFDALNEERRIEILAPALNRLAWYVGPTLEVPAVVGRRMVSYLITPDRYEYMLAEGDPLGPPVAAAWVWVDSRYPRDEVVVYLDRWRQSLWVRNAKVEEREHGIVDGAGDPALPATLWRLEVPTDPWDWLVDERHRRVQDATIEVSYQHTVLSWVRKSQNRKWPFLAGNLERLSKQQTLGDPELPFTMEVMPEDTPPQFDLKDADVSPANALSMIRFQYQTTFDSYGLPQLGWANEGAGTPNEIDSARQRDRLARLRAEQLPFLRTAEWESAWKAVAIAMQAGHPLAGSLPSPELVRETFQLSPPDLSEASTHEDYRARFAWEQRLGLVSEVDAVLDRYPDLSREQAAAHIRRMRAEQLTLRSTPDERPDDTREPATAAVGAAGAPGPAGPAGESVASEPG